MASAPTAQTRRTVERAAGKSCDSKRQAWNTASARGHDLALLLTTPTGLQSQLDCLKTCCQEMKMEVNKDKTKIMVFRKGGFLDKHEKKFYDDTRLEVVNIYCYLGFNFTTKLSYKQGTDHLAAKGKKAFQKYKEMTYETFFKIFDSKVQLIVLYASEMWGLQRLENIEKIHLMAC